MSLHFFFCISVTLQGTLTSLPLISCDESNCMVLCFAGLKKRRFHSRQRTSESRQLHRQDHHCDVAPDTAVVLACFGTSHHSISLSFTLFHSLPLTLFTSNLSLLSDTTLARACLIRVPKRGFLRTPTASSSSAPTATGSRRPSTPASLPSKSATTSQCRPPCTFHCAQTVNASSDRTH
jgi:hypothetical protein